jgi:decaprenylphospho-beta-D-ribofuranose 2-oxidase
MATDEALLTGWGGTAPSRAAVVRAYDAGDVAAMVRGPGRRGVLARGLGRSYGDAAQNAGGTVVLLDGEGAGIHLDPGSGLVTTGAGVSLDRLMRVLVPRGWFVPVTPGTRYVTVGGAIAADIHGKNHHVDGSWGAHVVALDLVLADGSTRTVGPGQEPDLFWATVGGMGLTGVVTSCTFRAVQVPTSRMLVDTARAADLDECMRLMAEADHRYRYSVAWIDLMATGAAMGRSVITWGDHAPVDALGPRDRRAPLAFDPQARLGTPPLVPGGLLNRATIRAFNEAWFRKAPRRREGEVQALSTFFHPLDGVRDWNRLYGPRGFLQYQFVLPFGEEARVRAIVERLAAAATPTFLAVLKRFGPGNEGMLSFPRPGWTLALDVPAAVPGLAALLDGLDEAVLAGGGRLYFAKESRMPAALVPPMYPRLDEWRAVRRRVDPTGVFQSDLARRLDLCGPTPQELS